MAIHENRCELVLSGAEITKRIDENGLDPNIFALNKLNYLEISRTSTVELPTTLGTLQHLRTLSLHSNQLSGIPLTLGNLSELKHLDISRNVIEFLPKSVNQLVQLHTLNMSTNLVSELPVMDQLDKLTVLDISHNQFDQMPPTLLDKRLVHLSELRARGNQITSLPAGLFLLNSLKILDVEDNKISKVAGEVGDLPKLKEVFLNGNPLSDRRLLKMVTQCHHKQIIDYIRMHCPREKVESTNVEGDKQKKKKKKKGKDVEGSGLGDIDQIVDSIRVIRLNDHLPAVVALESTKEVRRYIVCCVLRDVDLKSIGKFKKFISLQTKLHDNECNKRTLATIATHDLDKIVGGDLTYLARPPSEIWIVPLGRPKAVTALELFSQLQKEAEAVRKEKKRNTYSGIHKFLHLLEDKPLFPCLITANDQVISFPPITNSDVTKIEPDTKNVFVEVTSSMSLDICKDVLNVLIRESIALDLHDEEMETTRCRMVVQQVRVVNSDGQLKVLYPAQPDLHLDGVKVIREE